MDKSKALILEKSDVLPILLWLIIVFLTWLFMHGAEHYLQLTPEALGKYYTKRWILILHITAGGGALIFGLIQFWKKLRLYSQLLHKIVGSLYLLAILASSFCAIILAFSTAYHVNLQYAFSLQVWAAVWITSTVLAYYFVRVGKIKLHQEWMVRSYLLTLAFVVSGLAYKIPFVKELDTFENISPTLFWFGWSIPLFVYEVVKSR
jgi:uncharacterized membrane protein